MWNMTTYICKVKIRRLGRETYLSRTKNSMFALKSSKNTKIKLMVGTKNIGSVGLVEINNLFTPH